MNKNTALFYEKNEENNFFITTNLKHDISNGKHKFTLKIHLNKTLRVS